MSHLLLLMTSFIAFASCNYAKNTEENDICDKVFKSDKYISNVGMTVSKSTMFKCNGTFQSGTEYPQITEVHLGGNNIDYIGKWQLVKEIPEDIREAVREFGLKVDIYSISKYSSSNGFDGYCLYHNDEQYYSLSRLYLRQIPMSQYEHIGSLGIWEGFQE